MHAYNFGARVSSLKAVTSQTFPCFVLRGRHDNFGTTSRGPAPLKFGRQKASKIQRAVGQLWTLIANIFRMD